MAGSGECSRRSLPQLVGEIAREVEEQGAVLLLSTSEQCSGRHAQLSESPLVVGAVVDDSLLSAHLPQLAHKGVAVRNPYPQ